MASNLLAMASNLMVNVFFSFDLRDWHRTALSNLEKPCPWTLVVPELFVRSTVRVYLCHAEPQLSL